MKIAVICTGTELLKGAVTNTNLRFIGEQLMAHGMTPCLSLEVPDEMNAISARASSCGVGTACGTLPRRLLAAMRRTTCQSR